MYLQVNSFSHNHQKHTAKTYIFALPEKQRLAVGLQLMLESPIKCSRLLYAFYPDQRYKLRPGLWNEVRTAPEFASVYCY